MTAQEWRDALQQARANREQAVTQERELRDTAYARTADKRGWTAVLKDNVVTLADVHLVDDDARALRDWLIEKFPLTTEELAALSGRWIWSKVPQRVPHEPQPEGP